jgi:hypothetical protein
MLSYVYFGTNDLGKATTFYDATLAPLGMRRCITKERCEEAIHINDS